MFKHLRLVPVPLESGLRKVLQGYLAHKKTPTPLGPPYDPRQRSTVGSLGGAFSYERGTPAGHPEPHPFLISHQMNSHARMRHTRGPPHSSYLYQKKSGRKRGDARAGQTFRLRVVPFGTVIDSRTHTSQNREAVPRRARIQGSQTFVSLNSRLASNTDKEEDGPLLASSVATASLKRSRSSTLIAKVETLLSRVTVESSNEFSRKDAAHWRTS